MPDFSVSNALIAAFWLISELSGLIMLMVGLGVGGAILIWLSRRLDGFSL